MIALSTANDALQISRASPTTKAILQDVAVMRFRSDLLPSPANHLPLRCRALLYTA